MVFRMSLAKVKAFFVCLWVCLLVTYPVISKAEQNPITIACAANFSATMEKLVARFQARQQTPVALRVATGSSSGLATQIMHGAPYDLFFSADKQLVQRLMKKGIGYEHTRYAIGELVLYSRENMAAGLEAALLNITEATLAIANPKLAPYGAAAEAVLLKRGVQPRKLVRGTSVLHAFQFVESGHAQFGLIAKSLLQSTHQGHWLTIPSHWHPPIEQHALLLSQKATASAFFDFVQSEEGQSLIKASGYR